MGRASKDTTALALLTAYDAIVGLGSSAELAGESARLREEFQRRTGAFQAEDPWFEARSRAFWDDALAGGFGAHAQGGEAVPPDARPFARRFTRAHRGLFLVEDSKDADAKLVDLWSGAELLIRYLDEAQAVDLEHAEGLVDARVVGGDEEGALYVLPGAFHHAADATEPAERVVAAARDRGMTTRAALDALLRMELVFRSSSRVKAGFAYRVSSLPGA
jgi:hypothetical protein